MAKRTKSGKKSAPKITKRRRSRLGRRVPLSDSQVAGFTASLFGEDLHAKRVLSLSNGVIGVLKSATLGVHAIGRGLAGACGLLDKSAVKQVDRLLSNAGVNVWELFSLWVPYVLAGRKHVVVNLDWTEFDKDDHSTLVLGTQTHHGRSTPLLWQTVVKSKLKGMRNEHEYRLLRRLHEAVSPDVRVTVVADRGFSDTKLYKLLTELGFYFIIRFRNNVHVRNAAGVKKPAKEWLTKDGRLRQIKGAMVTAKRYPVASIVTVRSKGMKDAWFLATNDPSLSGQLLRKRYGKRFTCEETFRDIKDLRYGLGMSWNHIKNADRRDRMFLLAAMAHTLLTLLGEAGEQAGLDRLLKTNTSPKRQLSLFRQGLRWYELIPNMPEMRLITLMKSFEQVLLERELFRATFGIL